MKIEDYLSQAPIFMLDRTSRTLLSSVSATLKPEKLSFLQSLVLVAIFFENDNSALPSTLARSFQTTKANMSHCLSALERLGWVKRELREEDSRSYRISLTPDGRKKSIRLIKLYGDLQERFENQIGANRLQEGLSFLCQLAQALPAKRKRPNRFRTG